MELIANDDLIRERIREVIQNNGGAATIAKKTGIPLGTLNKYVAKSSTASFTNVAKIAAIVGVSLETIAFGKNKRPTSAPIEPKQANQFNLILELGEVVQRAYKNAEIYLSGTTEKHEINNLHKELLEVVRDVHQVAIVQAVIPELEKRLQIRLTEAKAAPGTGKREAS